MLAGVPLAVPSKVIRQVVSFSKESNLEFAPWGYTLLSTQNACPEIPGHGTLSCLEEENTSISKVKGC